MNLYAVPEANMQTFPPNNNRGGGSSRGYQTLGNPPGMVVKYLISMVLSVLFWFIDLGLCSFYPKHFLLLLNSCLGHICC